MIPRTLSRNAITDAACANPKIFGLFQRPVLHVFELDSPERWVAALSGARRVQERNARQLVQDALDAGERERGRYTDALEQLSFPRGHWYTEDPRERDAALMEGLEGLKLEVPENFLTNLDLEVEVETGPEDYAVGPGTAEWGRREQIRRVCEAINRTSRGTQRFYEYEADLPGWAECLKQKGPRSNAREGWCCTKLSTRC